MPPSSTTQIGPYRLDREIARGGMGVVYLAHDTRLGRTVALKSLPAEVASEPERRDRFERESRLLASLNHPNIAAIYDIVESDGRPFLALEHIDGETLAQRIARGPIGLHETLDIAFQIASGMEAAHEQGVIHRDLKPGNVMITSGDQVKIVDFGLAKGRLDAAQGEHSPTAHPAATISSPTMTSPTVASPADVGTIPGVILGTAPYLSPEQARGKPVDRRTDIWAFGCIVYECLTGQRAFEGETVSDTIARILEREPDWTRLPQATPPRLRDLLHRALEKDPKRRLRDMGEARLAIEEIRSGRATPAASTSAKTERKLRFDRHTLMLAFGIGLTLGAALALNMAGYLGGKHVAHLNGPAWASFGVPPHVRVLGYEITTDGKYFVILGAPKPAAGEEPPPQRLYARRMDSADFKPIDGSEGAEGFVLTHDGHYSFIAPASARSSLRKIFYGPVDGSAPPVPIRDADPSRIQATFLESGRVLASVAGKQWIIYAMKREDVTAPRPFDPRDSTKTYIVISSLPRDRGALLRVLSYDKGAFRQDIGVLDLKSGATKVVVRDGGSPHYASTGHLLFTRGGTLLAVPFDLGKLEARGEPVAIMGGLRSNSNWTHAAFEMAGNGTLLFARGGAGIQGRHAIMLNDDGTTAEWSGEHQPFERKLSVSPDGKRFASVITNSEAIYEIWVSTRGNPTSQKLIAVPGADCDQPLWSPDGHHIAYTQISDSPSDGVYDYPLPGGPPRFLCGREAPDQGIGLASWQPDGSQILCVLTSGTTSSLAVIDVPPPGGRPRTMRHLNLEGSVRSGAFSEDGRKLAYVQITESGKSDLFVRDYQRDGTLGAPYQVSRGGARVFVWTPDGRNLLYANDQGQGMIAFAPGPDGTVRPPIVTFPDLQKYRFVPDLGDALPDGRVLLIQRGDDEDDVTSFDVVFNFFDVLKEKMKRN
ncbi:MAG TPA: protein kinase [Candidatus Eisenbacteria bacterium]|nr:protein kinase [Candidatus Eisenbacteria bacterium]